MPDPSYSDLSFRDWNFIVRVNALFICHLIREQGQDKVVWSKKKKKKKDLANPCKQTGAKLFTSQSSLASRLLANSC